MGDPLACKGHPGTYNDILRRERSRDGDGGGRLTIENDLGDPKIVILINDRSDSTAVGLLSH
jgi:hypothetical protein